MLCSQSLANTVLWASRPKPPFFYVSASYYHWNTKHQFVSTIYFPHYFLQIPTGENTVTFFSLQGWSIMQLKFSGDNNVFVVVLFNNFNNTWMHECDLFVPSPVKGRLPLARATNGTGGDGWDGDRKWLMMGDELWYEGWQVNKKTMNEWINYSTKRWVHYLYSRLDIYWHP